MYDVVGLDHIQRALSTLSYQFNRIERLHSRIDQRHSDEQWRSPQSCDAVHSDSRRHILGLLRSRALTQHESFAVLGLLRFCDLGGVRLRLVLLIEEFLHYLVPPLDVLVLG